MNVEKFQEIANLLDHLDEERLFEHFEMAFVLGSYGMKEHLDNGLDMLAVEELNCGTVACICGWRLILDGMVPTNRLNGSAYWTRKDEEESKSGYWQDVAADSFVISKEAVERLAMTDLWPAAFREARDQAPVLNRIELRLAAKLVRDIADGLVDIEDPEGPEGWEAHGLLPENLFD